ncbi:hypothetical protein [Allohahella sp. A8]|uniref:hypothetical protein n=1 Tax=Allohahella sp. A8 TaxID=3141461 RepID=UPI003A806835
MSKLKALAQIILNEDSDCVCLCEVGGLTARSIAQCSSLSIRWRHSGFNGNAGVRKKVRDVMQKSGNRLASDQLVLTIDGVNGTF